MNTNTDIQNSITDALENIRFTDIFNLEDIQRLQDLFADAHGVASIITYPDGTPITNPSYFCRLCNTIIRKTEKGLANCYMSDAMLGKPNLSGSIVQPCLSGGLLDAGASISVGGKHIANWLIGQVRNEELDEQRTLQYADEIGANREDFRKALNEVPVMSTQQFTKVSKMLFAFASELSEKAYNNLQLKMQIVQQEKAAVLLRESEENMRYIVKHDPNAIAILDNNLHYIAVSERYLYDYDVKENDIIGKHHYDVFPEMPQQWKDIHQRCLSGAIEHNDDDSFVRPDGSITYNRWECRPWRRVNGEIGGIILYTEVTTERKQAEEALINSETRYRRLFESAKDGILILDAETGMILDVNPFLIEMLGYSEDQFIEKTIWEIGFFKDIIANRDKFIELQQKGYVRYEDLPHETADGQKINVEFVSNTYLVNKKKVIQCNIRDITKRRQAEVSLRNNEARLRTLVQTLPDLIWLKDTKGAYLSCNTMFARFIGAREDDIIGKTDYDFFERELADFFREHDRKAIVAGKPTRNEEWVTFADDGHRALLDTIKTPMFDSEGMLLGVLGIGRDITERKQAEETLHDSHQDLYRMLNSMYEGAYGVDINGNCTFVNRAFLQMLGYQNDHEVLGKHLHELIHHSHYDGSPYPSSECKMYRSYQINQTINISDEVFWRKDGVAIPVEYWSHPIEKDGVVIGSIATFIDITERKQAEEALKQANTELENLHNNLDEAVFSVDLIHNKMLHASIAHETVFGHSQAEFFNNPQLWYEIVVPEDKPIVDAGYPVLFSGKNLHHEFRIVHPDGQIRWIEAKMNPTLDSKGKLIRIDGIATNITARKQAEEELIKAKERAEESDRLKTSFLNNISHEIRTPFNGLLGFLSLIQDEYLPTSERDEYISIINKSADRLMNTINDIVEISQIQAGQTKLTISKTNIRKLSSELYSRFKPDVESGGLKFFLNDDLPNNIESIYTDSLKLNTILSHLIGNAIKFTKEGSIQFEIRFVDQGNEFGRDKAYLFSTPFKLQFSVKDTGVGIAKSKIHAIFEKFMQADGSNTRQFEGSGLGLSIAKAYVEMLGGKIWVESDPEGISQEKGSTFYFTIPFFNEPEEKNVVENVDSAGDSGNQIKPLKILIAEDDENSAALIALAFSKLNKDILFATTGVEAVKVCRNHPDIDLVLMDIKMPVMDGYEATRLIRKFNNDVVIIAQTAYALIGDREKAIEAGCNDYISKPINNEKLLGLIQKYLKK